MNQTLLNKYNVTFETIPKSEIGERMYYRYTRYYFMKLHKNDFVSYMDKLKENRPLSIHEVEFEERNLEYYHNELISLRDIKNDVLRIFWSNYQFYQSDNKDMFEVTKNVIEHMVEYYTNFDDKGKDTGAFYEFTKKLYIALEIYYYVDNLKNNNVNTNIQKLLENL